jgi:hypothetical protein
MLEPPPAPDRPPFFNETVRVDPKLHGNLRLDRSAAFAFAAGAQFVPLGLEEFEAAAQHYPILFTAADEPIAIALLSLSPDNNPFVRPDGSWQPDTYIPAYVRVFPFMLMERGGDLYLGVEPGAECLSIDKGEPLFDGDKPSKVLEDAIALAAAFRNSLAAAGELARTLNKAGLLEENQATVEFARGGQAVVRGFKVVKRDRFDKVNDDTLVEWHHRGWLAAIFAHQFSAGRWLALMDAAGNRRTATTH